MKCPNCGNEIQEGEKFCKFCGATIEDGLANREQCRDSVDKIKEDDHNGIRTGTRIAVLVIAVLMAVSGIVIYKTIQERSHTDGGDTIEAGLTSEITARDGPAETTGSTVQQSAVEEVTESSQQAEHDATAGASLQSDSVDNSADDVEETDESTDAYSANRDTGNNIGNHAPFYGIWCGAEKDYKKSEEIAEHIRSCGFPAEILVTTDWANLNTEEWYVITAGIYASKEDAEVMLSSVKEYYSDAYIKYSGEWIGD